MALDILLNVASLIPLLIGSLTDFIRLHLRGTVMVIVMVVNYEEWDSTFHESDTNHESMGVQAMPKYYLKSNYAKKKKDFFWSSKAVSRWSDGLSS